ncbi:MAG: hypothetical protein HQK53_16075 [Oligoflexia bacterium]|nr:hypothetical protein [Oligoflexia bacterium]
MPTKIFDADINKTWQAVIKVMRGYNFENQNQEAGVIRTAWEDNTSQMNFSDSFASNDSVKTAKFRLVINVVKGSSGGKEMTKVSVYKRQLVEQDYLQGWKEVPSDGILERTLLYRINRILQIDKQLSLLEKIKEQEALKDLN